MKVKRLNLFVLASSLFLGTSLFGEDSDEEIIQSTIELARSYLGDGDKLDSIKSIHYKGSLLYSTGDLGSIEMVYQAPMRHKMVAVVNNREEVSVLDGSEGWTSYKRVGDSVFLGMEIFDPVRILIMQASVRDSLGFYQAPKTRNGAISYEGKETINGHECNVLTYDYGDSIGYRRYIDAETGQLRKTLDSKGVEYFEEGEIVVDGIRFPKKLISTFPTAIGSQTMEFAYSEVVVNKLLPDSDFVMPLP